MQLNGKPIHDFRPEFETLIGVHKKGYRVFHIGVAVMEDGVRQIHEFVEAQSPDEVLKARVPVAEFETFEQARLAACFALAQLMVANDQDAAAKPAAANDPEEDPPQ